jgi:hypothetical protein
MAISNKKPTHTLRCGNIKATIWQNVSEKVCYDLVVYWLNLCWRQLCSANSL